MMQSLCQLCLRFGLFIGPLLLLLGISLTSCKINHVRHVPVVNNFQSSLYSQESNKPFALNKTEKVLHHAIHRRKHLKHALRKSDVEENDMENSIGLVGDVATNMDTAGRLKGPESGGAITNTIEKVKTKAKKFDSDKRKAMANGASEGLDAASGGVITLVQGIQSGAWLDICMGGLDLISSIASMLGPAGMMLSTALSIFSMIFGLFGGASGGEESTGDMVERLLNEALLKQKAEELRAESAGVKTLYESLSKSVSNFRQSRNITKTQAIKFYNRAFNGVRFFGQMKYYIDQWCAVGDVSDYEEDKKQDMKDQTGRCLEFMNLYCDLTILRQMLVMDMASLIKEIGGPEANSTVEDLLDLLKTEQKSDMTFLKMFVDPINYRAQRYPTAKYYAAIEQYGTLTNYIKKLDQLSTENGESQARKRSSEETPANKYFKPHILICEETIMQQGCQKVTRVGFHTKAQLGSWSGKIKSLFVSAGIYVDAFSEDNKGGAKFGPFYGPGCYNLRNEKIKVTSLEISSSAVEASSMLKVCDKTGMDMEGSCDTYKMDNYKQLYPEGGSVPTYDGDTEEGETKNCVFPWKFGEQEYNDCIKGGQAYYWCATSLTASKEFSTWGKCIFTKNWAAKIDSISIPAGMMVTAYKEENYGGEAYGPFYGPDVMSNVKPSNTWMSMKLETTTLTTSKLVKICENENLGGFCDHLEPKETAGETRDVPNVSGISGEDWATTDMKIKSIKVPGGFQVRVFSGESFTGVEYGPYTGPTTVKKVDGIEGDNRLKSMKIKKLY